MKNYCIFQYCHVQQACGTLWSAGMFVICFRVLAQLLTTHAFDTRFPLSVWANLQQEQ